MYLKELEPRLYAANLVAGEEIRPDPSHSLMQKISIGLLIAVTVLQIVEGAGMIAMLTGLIR